MGPYESVEKFNTDFKEMKKEYETIKENKEVKIDGKDYHVFTDNIDNDKKEKLFYKNPYSDPYLYLPQKFKGKYTRNGVDFGYVRGLTSKGIPQLTFTIQIKFKHI
jgi:hypothetical protein